jgi:hypothetical protein
MHLPSRHNPCEPLDRRWLRAAYLFKSGHRPSPTYDDSWISQAIAFMSALAACSNDFERQELADAMPAIFGSTSSKSRNSRVGDAAAAGASGQQLL